MHTSAHVSISSARNLSEEQVLLKTANTRLNIGGTNWVARIIIVPLSEILDNIYQLLTHGPVCQSYHSFTSLQSIHTSQVSYNNWR